MTAEKKQRPLIIGLTGSIGMGKSTVGQMFVDSGVPLFDADAAVHKLQGPGGKLLDEIEHLFPGTTGPNGVDRRQLGEAVLGNRQALERLEALIHPAVGKMRQEFLKEHADAPLIVFDIPLLFEKGGTDHVDHVVVVSASPEQQSARVLARPNMTDEKFKSILSLQLPDAEKRQRADTVIHTSVSLEETAEQVEALVKKLKATLA